MNIIINRINYNPEGICSIKYTLAEMRIPFHVGVLYVQVAPKDELEAIDVIKAFLIGAGHELDEDLEYVDKHSCVYCRRGFIEAVNNRAKLDDSDDS